MDRVCDLGAQVAARALQSLQDLVRAFHRVHRHPNRDSETRSSVNRRDALALELSKGVVRTARERRGDGHLDLLVQLFQFVMLRLVISEPRLLVFRHDSPEEWPESHSQSTIRVTRSSVRAAARALGQSSAGCALRAFETRHGKRQ